MMVFEKKCKSCGNWNEGHKLVCEDCHKPLRKMRLRDRLVRMHRDDPFELNWFKTEVSDTPVILLSKYIARVVSYTLLGIATFFIILIIIAAGIY